MLSTAAAVEKAIRLAQDAVRADEVGGVEEAIALYSESVDLINQGLQAQSDDEVVDNSVLHKYAKLYSDRIAELQQSIPLGDAVLGKTDEPLASSSALHATTISSAPTPGSPAAASSSASSSIQPFVFEEAELKAAQRPPPPPGGPDEWRRPFWLMRILRHSMQHGGYLTPDGRVFAPRRLWLQKGAKFAAMTAKVECAQCLLAELARAKAACDHTQPAALLKELERLGETMDMLQNSLHRVLPFVPEPRNATAASEREATTMSKLTERFKGLAKTLDKTAARLGAMPTKVSDPTEYVGILVSLLEAAESLEATWFEHHLRQGSPAEAGDGGGRRLQERLLRCAAFFYDVVCAFVIQDVDGLLQRHMRKAASGFIKGGED